jgi:hypothetical protein
VKPIDIKKLEGALGAVMPRPEVEAERRRRSVM